MDYCPSTAPWRTIGLLPINSSMAYYRITAQQQLAPWRTMGLLLNNSSKAYYGIIAQPQLHGVLLGGSGGVVNSVDLCPASLKSLGCFYFRCVLSSQWKAVTVNLQILHCQLIRYFWRPVVRMCPATSNNLLLVL